MLERPPPSEPALLGRGATRAIVVFAVAPWLACMVAAAYFVLRENHEPRDLAAVAWVAAVGTVAGVLLWRLRARLRRRGVAAVLGAAYLVGQAGLLAVLVGTAMALWMTVVSLPAVALNVYSLGGSASDAERPVRAVVDSDARTERRWTTPS